MITGRCVVHDRDNGALAAFQYSRSTGKVYEQPSSSGVSCNKNKIIR